MTSFCETYGVADVKNFQRQSVSPESLLTISTLSVSKHPAYSKLLDRKPVSRRFSALKLLSILRHVLGETILDIFLKEDQSLIFDTTSRIIDDHVDSPDPVQPKDLQLNLVVNMVVQAVRKQDLTKAARFHYGETLIRKCQFDAEFKYALKVALFDNNALNSQFMVISRHASVPRNGYGVWMTPK